MTAESRVVDRAAATLVVLAPDAPQPSLPDYVGTVRVPVDEAGRLDLRAVLRALSSRGVRSLLVEGGPTLAAAFLNAGLVDQVVGYIRVGVLGAGRSLLDLPDVQSMGDLRAFRLESVERLGEDIRITARVPRSRRRWLTAETGRVRVGGQGGLSTEVRIEDA